ncbi:MAG: RluA family pseudouridine synthase [Candidatus Paceibacterota bacterium]|jgi:23S rRNA pseudouridine1911/1915/1917 synthase
MKIEILYEDKDVLVVNKPTGLMVHPDGKSKGPFLTDWLLKKFPELKDVGESRPGIVHRLDVGTSGVLVIAKNQPTYLWLKKQFQNRKISKVYNAFVWGEMKDDRGMIDKPIGRSKNDFRQRSAERGKKGKIRDAITHFVVKKKSGGFSFLEVRPKTGRTHQIRVHLKAVGYPVVGDSLYAPKRPLALGFNRLALHAFSIEFENPAGQTISVIAPLPEDFQSALKGF